MGGERPWPLWPGTIGPAEATPGRRPGSIRRTTSVDIRWPDGIGGQLLLAGRARDLLTPADGPPTVMAEAFTEVLLGGLETRRTVQRIRTEPALDTVQALVGRPASGGFRYALDEVVPELTIDGSLLGVLLDDVPVTALISGAAVTWVAAPVSHGTPRSPTPPPPDSATDTPPPPPPAPPDGSPGTPQAAVPSLPPDGSPVVRRGPKVDICAGWAAGGEMDRRSSTGERPLRGEGPAAPPVTRADDPWAWHDDPPLPPGAMRRRRRHDLWRDGEVIRIDSLFRDVAVEEDGLEYVVHEYGVTAEVTDGGEILSIRATAHALPGPDCPAAAASALRLVGRALADVRPHVRRDFTGTSTCTHLNDELRALGDVHSLLDRVP